MGVSLQEDNEKEQSMRQDLDVIEQELDQYLSELNAGKQDDTASNLPEDEKDEKPVRVRRVRPSKAGAEAVIPERIDKKLDTIDNKLEDLDARADLVEEIDTKVERIDDKLNVDFVAMYDNVLDQMNVESVKIYRNLQAVMVEENAKQNTVLFGVDGKSDSLRKRINHMVAISVISIVVSIAVMVVLILPKFGIKLY